MADVNTIYHCGCNYRTARLEEAIKHSDERKHIMGVQGEIRPDRHIQADKVDKAPTIRAQVAADKPQEDPMPAIQAKDFNDMRAKLLRHKNGK